MGNRASKNLKDAIELRKKKVRERIEALYDQEFQRALDAHNRNDPEHKWKRMKRGCSRIINIQSLDLEPMSAENVALSVNQAWNRAKRTVCDILTGDDTGSIKEKAQSVLEAITNGASPAKQDHLCCVRIAAGQACPLPGPLLLPGMWGGGLYKVRLPPPGSGVRSSGWEDQENKRQRNDAAHKNPGGWSPLSNDSIL